MASQMEDRRGCFGRRDYVSSADASAELCHLGAILAHEEHEAEEEEESSWQVNGRGHLRRPLSTSFPTSCRKKLVSFRSSFLPGFHAFFLIFEISRKRRLSSIWKHYLQKVEIIFHKYFDTLCKLFNIINCIYHS